jgi:hypothetical protein
LGDLGRQQAVTVLGKAAEGWEQGFPPDMPADFIAR